MHVATSYLGVLQQLDQIKNATDNHDRLVRSAQRAERRGQAGREKKAQVDEAQQEVLRARVSVINARDNYQGQLGALKLTLGLPTDARIARDPRESSALAAPAKAAAQVELDAVETPAMRGKLELPVVQAIELALTNRLDLRAAQGRGVDAQRGVVVAADGLKADLTLTGTTAMGGGKGLGSATNAYPRPDEGVYSATGTSDLPWERTAERNAYPELRPGYTCEVEIVVAHYEDVLSVPLQAVQLVWGKPTAYVKTPSGPVPRVVEVGMDNNRLVHIKGGLKEGEHVLLAPPLDETETDRAARARRLRRVGPQ